MPKRNPPNQIGTARSRRAPNAPQPPPAPPPDLLTLLLFWPFLLWRMITRGWSAGTRIPARILGYPCIAGLYVLVILGVVYGTLAQRYDLRKIRAMPTRSIVYDRNGEELGRIHGEKRSIVPLDQVAESFREAILAREDARFFQHPAIDPIGIVRAIVRNLDGKREGASTITQQLASDVFKLKQGEQRGQFFKQLNRKFLEVAIAFRLEANYSKEKLLEAYINQINWGRQIKGVGEASRIYFEKHPAELTLSESALLAGIVRGPDAYNPFRSLDDATRERNTTLDRMVDAGKITVDEADIAKAERVTVRPEWRRSYKESYAMDKIRRDLEIILNQEDIELGGLQIITTIDKRIQQAAEEALDEKLRVIERGRGYKHRTRAAWLDLPEEGRGAPDYLQGASVVMENRTGAVVSIVGGRDAGESAFNRAFQARRQLGSTFKPFIYLAAFEEGIQPGTRISDGPLQPGEIVGGKGWRPRNSDGTYGGMLPARDGLIRSRNTMSIRLGNHAGIPKVKELARIAGFSTPMPETPVSFLGSWDASPWEVASAFMIFPNSGVGVRPYVIAEIRDRENNILWPNAKIDFHVADPGPSWQVSEILQQVAKSGTAASVKRLGFDQPCGGKTGTTDDFKDAWFVGYTSSLTCAVWVGFDRPETIMEGGYGSTLALPVWVDVMKTATRLGYPAGSLDDDVKLTECRLCRLSGRRATAGCEAAGTAENVRLPVDSAPAENDFCPIHPAKALAVSEDEAGLPPESDDPPHRALPVHEEPLRAIPVE